MKFQPILFVFVLMTSLHASAKASDEKHHGEGAHEEKEEHGHKEEEKPSGSVGPNKGIQEASESEGIKLSPEAIKNFEIKTLRLKGSNSWVVPLSARFQSGEETNLFRLRAGFFKRIDFVVSKKDSQQLTVSSRDLRDGDEIVVSGIGYLRIAEVAAFGGAPEDHPH